MENESQTSDSLECLRTKLPQSTAFSLPNAPDNHDQHHQDCLDSSFDLQLAEFKEKLQGDCGDVSSPADRPCLDSRGFKEERGRKLRPNVSRSWMAYLRERLDKGVLAVSAHNHSLQEEKQFSSPRVTTESTLVKDKKNFWFGSDPQNDKKRTK